VDIQDGVLSCHDSSVLEFVDCGLSASFVNVDRHTLCCF
jgi:hypothetical protein